MRLHRVEIKNFRRHEHLELDLCDDTGTPRPLTVLVGPNMSGKTTVLDAIHLAYEIERNPKKPAYRQGFDAGPTVRPDPNAPIEIELRWSLHDGEWEALNEINAAMHSQLLAPRAPLYRLRMRYLGDVQGALVEVADADPPDAELALRGRSLAELAMNRRVKREDVLDRAGGVLYLEQNRHGRLGSVDERLDFAREAMPGLPDPDVVGWLARVSLQHMKWDAATRGESRWARAQRLFHDLAAPADLDDAVPYDSGYDLRFHREDRAYSMAGTSSGERQILRLAANLSFFRAQRTIVLLDELELNLHPRWQRSLLRFCETGGDGDNQFIVTTHSDVVLSYADPSSVVTLGVPKDGWS